MENISLHTTESCRETCTNCHKCVELELLVKAQEEQIRLLTLKLFGKKSERHEIEGQSFLFDEAVVECNTDLPEQEMEQITYDRRKRKGKREEDLSGLPVEQIRHELSESDQICPECGEGLHVMGHDVRKEVEIIPASFKVIEHIQDVYSCRNCEKHNTHVPIIKAPMPEPVIKGSIASPSAVAHIMTQKYVNAMPFYRQEQDFSRNGFILSRQTMANWMIKCSFDWLESLYERMKKLLLARKIAHADETVIQVLKEPGKAADTNSYIWLYRSSGDTGKHIVIYEYQESRAGEHPKKFLEEFTGFLHADGYQPYHNLPSNIIVVGCWTHGRRKFDEAFKVIPKDAREGSSAEKGLWYYKKLFDLERDFNELTAEERYEQRLLYSKPIALEFYKWVDSLNALPQTLLGKAVNYIKEQWKYLMNVYLDGRLEFTNNRAERSIKPVAIGRKNYLFYNTPDGAKAGAIIYSIVLTAIENGLNPFQYLKYLFEQLPNSIEPVETFLPWSDSIPESCKIPVKRKETRHGDDEHKLHDELCEKVS